MRLVANFGSERKQDNPVIRGKEMKLLPKQNYTLEFMTLPLFNVSLNRAGYAVCFN